MFTEIEIELALAAGIVLLAIFCVGKSPFIRPSELTVTNFVIIVTGIFFGFGPFASYVIGGGSLSGEGLPTILAAYATVALFIVGLAIFPFLIRYILPNYRSVTIWESFSAALNVPWSVVLFIHVAVWIIRFLVAIYFGIMFYGTATSDRVLNIPYHFVVLQIFVEFLESSAFTWAAVRIWETKQQKTFLTAIVILITGFIWAFIQGRRPMFIATLLFFYCYAAQANTVRFRQITFAIFVFGGLLFVGFPAFIRLRMAHELLGNDDDAVAHVYRTTMSASKITNSELNSYYEDNMSERPLIIRFICKILESQEDQPGMHGQAFLNSVIWAIPSPIYTDKKKTLMTEQYIQVYYYQRLFDTSLTWPATGCADFGYPGGFVIGLVLAGLIACIEQWCKKILSNFPLVAISLMGGLLMLVTNVESDPLEIFCLIRSAIILYVIARILRVFGISETLSIKFSDTDQLADLPAPKFAESNGDSRLPNRL